MTTANKLSLFLLAGVFLLSGCWNPFHPALEDDSTAEIHNRTPLELLNNLQRAYNERNIDIYKTLLAPDFRFELISSEVSQIGIDVNDDGIPDSWWGYDQEVAFTANLFTNGSSDGTRPEPDQLDLRLTIPPEENWESDPELGHETWIVIPCGFNLSLTYLESNTALTATGLARFYLKPASNRWYIAIWRDESNL